MGGTEPARDSCKVEETGDSSVAGGGGWLPLTVVPSDTCPHHTTLPGSYQTEETSAAKFYNM